MTLPQGLITFEEYLAYDDGTDTRYELVDGRIHAIPPPSPEHQALARVLLINLLQHFPIDRIASNTEIEVTGRLARCRVPDIVVHSKASLKALVGAKRALLTRDMPPPIIVIEIVGHGKTNHSRDYRHKHTEYAARCIAEYWIVDPQERQIVLCQWTDGQYEDTIFRGEAPMRSAIARTLELTSDRLFTFSPWQRTSSHRSR